MFLRVIASNFYISLFDHIQPSVLNHNFCCNKLVCTLIVKLASCLEMMDDIRTLIRLLIDLRLFVFRIEFVLNAVKNRFDSHAALLIKYFFKLAAAKTTSWLPALNPVPIAYLKDAVVSDVNGSYVFKYFDQYVKLIGK